MPAYLKSFEYIFFRCPRFATPSSIISPIMVCRAWFLPCTLKSEPIFQPQLPYILPHLFYILSEKDIPFELLCPKMPVAAISIAWSSAAKVRPLLSSKAGIGCCFNKKLQASVQAPFPSLVAQLHPGFKGKVVGLIKESSYFLTWTAKPEGLVLAQFMYFKVYSAGTTDMQIKISLYLINQKIYRLYLIQSMLLSITITILLLCISTQNNPKHPSPQVQPAFLSILSQIQVEIQRLSYKQSLINMKFSRLNENSLKKDHYNPMEEGFYILPSISIPYKDNIYYHMMLGINRHYYDLRGDSIYNSTSNSTLVTSIRNQHTYFAEINHENSTVEINKLKIINKKTEVHHEITISLPPLPQHFNHLIVVYSSGQITYLLSNSEGLLLFFDKSGKYLKQINVNETIRKIQKVGNNIVLLTETKLVFFQIMKKFTKISCMLPLSSIDTFTFDQSNFRYLYGQKQSNVYKIELSETCKVVKQYHILQNSSIFPASEIILVESPQIRYFINMTDHTTNTYDLPIAQCKGTEKIFVNRKMQANYIISQVCIDSNYYNITHILVQFQDKSNEMANFSKFRIPLLLLSFGIIIYITMKNKSKNAQKQQMNDNEMQADILKKLSNFQNRDHLVRQSETKSRNGLNSIRKDAHVLHELKNRNV